MLQASMHIVCQHTVCHKNIHDSKIPAEIYHKILVHDRKNWAHSTLSQQKTRGQSCLNGQEEDGKGEQMTRTRGMCM